jgi:hypothetical protein
VGVALHPVFDRDVQTVAAERGPASATSPAAWAQIWGVVMAGSPRSPSMCASVISRQRFA